MMATRLLHLICDPAKIEAIEGDLIELYDGRRGWRYWRDVLSVCARLPRAAVRSLAAAVIVLALTSAPPEAAHYTVRAVDPAGEFALEILHGRAIAASMNGVAVLAQDLLQSGDTLIIRHGDNGADFRIAIKPEGGIAWYPRQSFSR